MDCLDVDVFPGVYEPREDTQLMFEALSKLFSLGFNPRTVLEVGTGSGALLLCVHSLFPNAKLFAIDTSPTAVENARHNASKRNVSVEISLGDVCELKGKFDLIFFNPPYLSKGPEPLDETIHDTGQISCFLNKVKDHMTELGISLLLLSDNNVNYSRYLYTIENIGGFEFLRKSFFFEDLIVFLIPKNPDSLPFTLKNFNEGRVEEG